ncbi:MAG: DegT/DnrJ/EryC1/StrS family aminotransferase [Flavobacteriales bacterium]|nr:DegT/DnrJ/EryC1/StrS family aminotransferase [Flavobacteriales bacterium]
MPEKLNVTKSFLPPLEEYQQMVAEIWQSGQLTNFGDKTKELEKKLEEHLGVKHLQLVSNGTVALQLAIKALNLKGQIITTPFSYVATVSSIVWEGCSPVFVDINHNDLCIDADLIEAAITEKTSAILATHVYGHPCNTEKIKVLAEKYELKVIYDAAHAFGVKKNGESILNHGDISTLSFHATKIFQTAEGGAVITNNNQLDKRLRSHGNFGHSGQEAFDGLGINSKTSELHAAMGLCVLPQMEKIIAARKKAVLLYNSLLADSTLIGFTPQPNVTHNYSYCPVLFPSEKLLLKTQTELNANNIFPRRYFYPSLDRLPYVKNERPLPVGHDISERVMCLPLSAEISEDNIGLVCRIILNNL